ncbi:unnamed protein product, partial [Ectocarpus sp. 12 AP-2014]
PAQARPLRQRGVLHLRAVQEQPRHLLVPLAPCRFYCWVPVPAATAVPRRQREPDVCGLEERHGQEAKDKLVETLPLLLVPDEAPPLHRRRFGCCRRVVRGQQRPWQPFPI